MLGSRHQLASQQHRSCCLLSITAAALQHYQVALQGLVAVQYPDSTSHYLHSSFSITAALHICMQVVASKQSSLFQHQHHISTYHPSSTIDPALSSQQIHQHLTTQQHLSNSSTALAAQQGHHNTVAAGRQPSKSSRIKSLQQQDMRIDQCSSQPSLRTEHMAPVQGETRCIPIEGLATEYSIISSIFSTQNQQLLSRGARPQQSRSRQQIIQQGSSHLHIIRTKTATAYTQNIEGDRQGQ